MHRAPTYLTDTLPGQGRRPPLDVTLHAEDHTLVLAVFSAVPSRTFLPVRGVGVPLPATCVPAAGIDLK